MKNKKINNIHYQHSRSYTGRRNHKKFWRAAGISNAFKHYLDYYVRIPAMRMFFNLIEEIIQKVYTLGDREYEPDSPEKVKAQLAICYTNYPAGLAIMAAGGHTAWIQHKKLVNHETLTKSLSKRIFNYYSLFLSAKNTDMEVAGRISMKIASAICERIYLEELCRAGLEKSIEAYRFFLASSFDLKFESLPQIIHAVILLGDVLPHCNDMKLHPFTKDLFGAIYKASSPFFRDLDKTPSHELIRTGEKWGRSVFSGIMKYFPGNEISEDDPFSDNMGFQDPSGKGIPKSPDEESPGLDNPTPPVLEEAPLEKVFREILSGMKSISLKSSWDGSDDELTEYEKTILGEIADAAKTIMGSSGQGSSIQDVRSDIVMEGLFLNPFEAGPIEGSPTEGNDVEVDLGEHGTAKGAIYDQAFELSFNLDDVNSLINEARPLTNQMKKNIFPNTEQVPVAEKLRASGMIDPGRLSCHPFSDAIFKRFLNEERLDKRGRPLVLIVCDGSGSMGHDKMHMLKILTTAWIHSTLKSSVMVMAGMYNNGYVGKNRYGSLVRWIYHPAKTPAGSKKEALRAVAGLPESGSGGQEDALAIGYMLQEADKYVRDKRIYMIHITDTGFCSSFTNGLSAEDEVVAVLSKRKTDHREKFHYTLVGLGINSGGKVEDLADKMICLPSGQLSDPFAAASKIGLYVSACMKERNRIVKTKQ